jgi:hypothetical protein
MSYSLNQEEYFVILETSKPEQIVSAAEMHSRLVDWLLAHPEDLPRGLEEFPSPEAQADHLMDTVCELPMPRGEFFQWYAIRLEK